MRKSMPVRRAASSRHVDDWLMTYADMITLLLCFFILFLSLSLTAMQKKVEEPPHPAPPEIAQAEGVAMVPADTEILAVINAEPQEPPQPVFEEKGDRLTTVEMDSAAFFDSGSATLTQIGRDVLRGVAAKIGGAQYKDYQITVEGHTDDTPIATPQFPSNWELSTARAASVVRAFLEEGLPPQRLRAAGYADTFPKAPNRDETGNPIAENRAQNRRVVIKLERIEKNLKNAGEKEDGLSAD